ncbi:hypothetical protein RH915_00480 [Serpentinicella sp. ANB-PHB4]|uniref:hypothetical protein n=1 Tax=Serpentinicella sp. ANB-PHB4 TaxID=3074076 RepID=UPI002863F1FD|nr:hypothetical protein [Serpentinicella sp. ANB-PHB4]MDR5657953.1 hypothetical protein [Serpentinicella sp. ANB-PHB4]
MKNLLFLISFIVLALLSFFIQTLFKSPDDVATFIQYTSSEYKLNSSTISYFFDNDYINSDIEREVKRSVLSTLGYQKWLDYVDFIDISVYKDNIIPNDAEQLIINLNLSQDLAVVAIYNQIGKEYIFEKSIKNILPVSNIDFIECPDKSHHMMLLYQTLDESLGAMLYKEFLEIYHYHDEKFNVVWDQTIYLEEVYNESWLYNNSDRDRWCRVEESIKFKILKEEDLFINTYTKLDKFTAKSSFIPPQNNDFNLLESKEFNSSYHWSPDHQKFIIGKITEENFLKNIGIIKDMENSIDALRGLSNNNYRVISLDGKYFHMDKGFRYMMEN